MRLLSCLIILLLPALQLPATAYRANSIGQLVSEIPSLTGVGYEAESSGGTVTFYSDGNVVRRTSQDGNTRIVEEGGAVTTVLYDESGNILSETIRNGDSESVKNYEYTENGILNRVIESVNGEINQITTYLYSPASQLAAIYYDTPDGSVSYVSASSFSYLDDGVPVRVTEYPGLLVRDEYGALQDGRSVERNADGSITVSESSDAGRRESTYSPDGALLSRRILDDEGATSYTESYSYENGILTGSSVTEGPVHTDSYYSSGVLVSEDRYMDGVLTAHREYAPDRSFTETVYRSGRPYAAVGYDADGVRVLSLEVL